MNEMRNFLKIPKIDIALSLSLLYYCIVVSKYYFSLKERRFSVYAEKPAFFSANFRIRSFYEKV